MRKINLLAEIPSIRNTLRPDGSYHGKNRGFGANKKTAAGLLLAAGAVAFALWSNGAFSRFPWRGGETLKAETSPAPLYDEMPQPAAREKMEEREASVAPIAPAPQMEPALVPQELISRPVAQDAQVKPGQAEKKKPSTGPKKWRLRFGVCIYSKSCTELLTNLKSRGLLIGMEEGLAEITAHKVMIGPFPTKTHAIESAERFKSNGYNLAPFMAEDRYYLGAETYLDLKSQKGALAMAKSLGLKAEGGLARENRRVYKVYGGITYPVKEEAEKTARALKGRGIECLVELLE
ncbi:MAG: hypothetical protein HY751_10910 [Nitrospinae bacterium]|nr:hypothetical protein [Nitrospinota bacterium]